MRERRWADSHCQLASHNEFADIFCRKHGEK